MNKYLLIGLIVLFCVAFLTIVYAFIVYHRRMVYRKAHVNDVPDTYTDKFPKSWYEQLIAHVTTLTLDEFESNLDIYKRVKGCYIIENQSRFNKIYVGQSVNLAWRVPQHFHDYQRGNRKIHQDFDNGDQFTIRLIKWDSSMPDINVLEASLIRFFKSDSHYGYNRTLGRNFTNTEVIKK